MNSIIMRVRSASVPAATRFYVISSKDMQINMLINNRLYCGASYWSSFVGSVAVRVMRGNKSLNLSFDFLLSEASGV